LGQQQKPTRRKDKTRRNPDAFRHLKPFIPDETLGSEKNFQTRVFA
jgi:hypothetical protein